MQEEKIKLYDANNIDSLPWPENKEGIDPKSFLIPFVKDGAHEYIQNISTKMMVLSYEDQVFPITVNEEEYDNCFVCSPYTQYTSYGLQKIQEIDNRPVRVFCQSLIKVMQKVLRRGKINKIVYVNNWLFPTNLYPDVEKEFIPPITEFLKKRFPDHAISFRCVNKYSYNTLYQSLRNNCYKMVASKQVFFVDGKEKKAYRSRCFKKDEKLFEKGEYQVVPIHEVDDTEIPRIHSLYHSLYIEKYTPLNLQFTPKFMELLKKKGPITFNAFKKDGKIDAIQGYYWQDGVITAPIFGYDTSLPVETGLYRLLSVYMMIEARKRGLKLNQSSGAASFKKLRRAETVLEYNAVYTKHLPLSRRLTWQFLKTIINGIGVPIMRWYEF